MAHLVHRRLGLPDRALEVALGIREGQGDSWDHASWEDRAVDRARRKWLAGLAGGILVFHLVEAALRQGCEDVGTPCGQARRLALGRRRA